MISDVGVLGRDACAVGRETVYRLVVCDSSRFEEYHQKAFEFLGVEFPVDYYKRSVTLTLIDQLGDMWGGAIIALEPEFRSLLSIPNQTSGYSQGLEPMSSVAEINGVWLAPGVKSPILPVTFWRQLINFLLTLDKDRFLFTFDLSNKTMRKITSWLRYDVLYSGPTHQLPGMKQPSCETIAVLHRDSFAAMNDTLNRFEGSAVPVYDDPIAKPAPR
ncbi:MAG: hypothetical protein JNL67_15950 [Planctomycetaceae bacterium]|nr:hypothetical protein [Planctomycetaceae bacterium]